MALSFSIVSIPDPLQSVAIAGGVLYILWLVGYFVTFSGPRPARPPAAGRCACESVRWEASACPRRALLRFAALTLAALPLFAGFR